MLNMKNSKKEIQDHAEKLGLQFNTKHTKGDLLEMIENYENSKNEESQNEESVNTLATINEEKIENETKPSGETLSGAYRTHLENIVAENDLIELHIQSSNEFIVKGPKKTLAVRINDEDELIHVYTVLNRREFEAKNARNILTLKSLKALKSYTACHTK